MQFSTRHLNLYKHTWVRIYTDVGQLLTGELLTGEYLTRELLTGELLTRICPW